MKELSTVTNEDLVIVTNEPQKTDKPQMTYVQGDATYPKSTDSKPKVIAHCCNDLGAWGAGFTRSLDKRWEAPKTVYKMWASGQLPLFELGGISLVPVGGGIWVANMIAQEGLISAKNPTPINYKALRTCLNRLRQGMPEQATVHMPALIGAGLAGGNPRIIESIIQETLVENGVPVYMYIFT